MIKDVGALVGKPVEVKVNARLKEEGVVVNVVKKDNPEETSMEVSCSSDGGTHKKFILSQSVRAGTIVFDIYSMM